MESKELEEVFESFKRRRGNREVFQEEVEVIEDWFNYISIDAGMLENVLSGRLSIDVEAGQLVFCMTTEGSEDATKLVSDNKEAREMIAKMEANGKPEKQPTIADRIMIFMHLGCKAEDFPEGSVAQVELFSRVLGESVPAIQLAMVDLEKRGMISRDDV